ncbi:leucine-rich PPR motif-containing protein, mitochondrial-like [Hylaeus volcanicus]|uniref:leucine-rich PPR motif-containing protein, mitochondrial-like n=1 Tax=Hylaeus volcanicus TaxID=313075 RepID=UPI0023B7C8E5|nr:leucine-rich PPR motif-containing protein, mitochondrial-like [Hylaeus volcanicus]
MASVLLRFIKRYGHFPQNLIFKRKKKPISVMFEWCNDPLFILTRNMSSIPRNSTELDIYVIINKIFNQIQTDVLIYRWTRKNSFERMFRTIKAPDHVSSGQALLLLRWCSIVMDCLPSERFVLGEYIWCHLSVCNVLMNSSHYNALLQIHLENDAFLPMEFLTKMKNKGIRPDTITYEKLIECHCRKGSINHALELVQNMKEQKFPITEAIYNSLIIGYSQIDDQENAIKTFIKMKESKVQPTAEAYSALICGYAKKNDTRKVKEIIADCSLNDNIYFSNKNILNIIYTLLINNHIQSVNTMYKYMRKSCIFSIDEISLLLKLIYINKTGVVLNILSYVEDVATVNLVLETMVFTNTKIDEIVNMCTIFENRKICKDPLLQALYYSYLKDDDCLCLPLLRKCKLRYITKPHYFWPLLIKRANKYDFNGIINILQIMIHEFDLSPCIDTIADYIIPFMFGSVVMIRMRLINYKVNETTIDNACVLFLLKQGRLKRVVTYMKTYPNYYFYTEIVYGLWNALLETNDIESFVSISNNLVDYTDSNERLKYSMITFVPLEKQLLDFMIAYPHNKVILMKLILHLSNQGMSIKQETAEKLLNFLEECAKDDVIDAVYNMAHRMQEVHLN